MRTLHVVIGKRLADLAMLSRYRNRGPSAAIALSDQRRHGHRRGHQTKSWINCAT